MGMFPMGELLWLCTKASPHDFVDPSIAWPIPVDFPLPEYGECPLSQHARCLTEVSLLQIGTTSFGPRLSNEWHVAYRYINHVFERLLI